jgi:hypothetical protein
MAELGPNSWGQMSYKDILGHYWGQMGQINDILSQKLPNMNRH